MSKKKKKEAPKGKRSSAPGKAKHVPKSASSTTAKSREGKGKPGGDGEHKRTDGIAERFHLGSQAFRADVRTLLAEVGKEGGKLSAKARKAFAEVSKEYRKAAKDLKKLGVRKGH
jgi:hypothetical protein